MSRTSKIPTTETRSKPKVLVFDSGVGGLTIVAEIQKLLPHCELLFVADNQAFPYGTKSESFVQERVVKVLAKAIAEVPVHMIVIACNTASTVILPTLRAEFDMPIVGVVPAIKPAALLTETGVIGVLATPGTVQRRYTQELISEFAQGTEVILVGAPELVALAEGKMDGNSVDMPALQRAIQPMLDHPLAGRLDTIVLACTHFPWLAPELDELMPQPIQWVDSGAAIARRVQALLADTDALSERDLSKNEVTHQAFATASSSSLSLLAQQQLSCELKVLAGFQADVKHESKD